MRLVVITQITLKKVAQILEGSMSFVDRYNLITEIFNFYIILEKIKQEGLIRAKVPKTKENLQKCICMKCPSYTFTCKIKSMPGNIILMLGEMSYKIHAEAMFCAYEKSSCIDEEKGCNCGNCDLFKEYELGKGYFCIVSDGK